MQEVKVCKKLKKLEVVNEVMNYELVNSER
jgi:hypothetical protein